LESKAIGDHGSPAVGAKADGSVDHGGVEVDAAASSHSTRRELRGSVCSQLLRFFSISIEMGCEMG
jgi:hypothetical protein